MKDFQEQSIGTLQNKINELQEENNRLKAKILTEADVKMIVSKTLDNKNNQNNHNFYRSEPMEEKKKRSSFSQNEPINLQIKTSKGRFRNNFSKGSNLKQLNTEDEGK